MPALAPAGSPRWFAETPIGAAQVVGTFSRMTWRAYLRGEADDLHALGDQFRTGDVVVQQHDGEWVLTAGQLDC